MNKPSSNQLIRVLVVEDSRPQRELLIGLLQNSGMFQVVGMAGDGREAVLATMKLRPDVIAMDIHLPVIDGYEATRQIMQRCPTPIVMVSSSNGDAEMRSVQSLAAGALAVVHKPGSLHSAGSQEERTNFLTMLRLMAGVKVVTRHPPRTPPATGGLPYRSDSQPQVLAIAASTGGPAAVQTLLNGLEANYPLPILVVQHIARGFVSALVDWLNSTTPLTVQLAEQDERLLPGHVYLAPDDRHMQLAGRGRVMLRPGVSTDRYCPGADILFNSVAQNYGGRAIGVIMTGMGDDGARGLYALRAAGGLTLGQDEASCVVYGMPQAAVIAGAVAQVESLANLANVVLALTGKPAERVAAK
jgi:two-component system, chemotaxis family, protein-glutamate methylesterase/glutaminase